MSYFVAPDTGKRYDIFGPSYAERVAELAQAPLMARIPLDPAKAALVDAGNVEAIDDPVCDELAARLVEMAEARPSEKETISLL
jgi:hypothetical protein